MMQPLPKIATNNQCRIAKLQAENAKLEEEKRRLIIARNEKGELNAKLRQDLGLLQIGLDHTKTLLASCESALESRDEKIEKLQQELLEITVNAEQQLAQEAKRYVSLSNSLIAGELKYPMEGSIFNESVYVDTRVQDIKDPLFGSLKERLNSHNLKQQAKGLDRLSESMLFRGYLENTADRDEVDDFAKSLRSLAKEQNND